MENDSLNKADNAMRTQFTMMLVMILTLVLSSNTAQASEATFSEWLTNFRTEAKAAGLSDATIKEALSDVRYIPRVIELDRKQPEGSMTFVQYRKKIVSDIRINKGREMLRKHRAILDKVSAEYGVPPQYIVALWGIETSYGRITGGFDIVDSLATLAHDGRRGAFFKAELIKALKIIDQGHIKKKNMKGSWAGAMGQSQFMPSSFLAYAEDFDGDGRRDIWTTQEDVFASIANYLSKSGWIEDQRWGRLVSLQRPIPESMMGRKVKKSLDEWRSFGVVLPNGGAIPVVAGMKASLVAPDGYPGGPVYLTYSNYDVIMKWNRSTYFATSVGLLANAIGAAL